MDLRPERRMMSMMFLSLLIHVIGSLEAAADYTCSEAFKSKRLISPEKLTNINHNVESRFWYKDGNLVSWINEKGFKEGKGYEGRLRHVGDGNIEIKNVTRNDSGIYQSTSQFRGVSNTLTASVNLQVIDAPANTCKPVISHEGSNLIAYLPSVDVCTTSQLRLEWMGTNNKTVTTRNGTTILDLGTDSGEKDYMVCAVGEATKCFHGNMSDFCTNYTVPQHQQSGDGVTLHPAEVAIIIIIVIPIGVIIILCVLRHKGIICKKSSQKMDEEQKLGLPLILKTTQNMDEDQGFSFIPKSDLSKIRGYLQNHYGTMTDVSVSPVGEINVSVSKVFVTLELERIETRDTEDTNTYLTGATPCDSLVSKENNFMTQNKLFPLIIIVGDSGSGKSTWCKHLVHCWSYNSEMGDIEMQGLNLSHLINFQLLLYLPLKHSDEGLSFQKLLQQYLFPTQLSYLEFVSNHMNGQNLSQAILIVIDGLDKISKNSCLKLISELLVSKLSSCTFILTSRPSSFNQISVACVDRTIKLYNIREMTLEESTKYVSNYLNIINQQDNTKLNPVHFLTFTKYLHVNCLLTSPYYCLSLLHVWMQNKNRDIQMIDIIFIILKNLLNHNMHIKSCNQKILERLTDIKDFVGSISEIADEIFKSEMKILTGVKGPCHENVTQGSNMLEAACELGLITKSPTLDSKENISNLNFTNTLIYHFLVSYAVGLKKGPTFDYIVSGLDIALENYRIIHMTCQFSPAIGQEIFNKTNKQKNQNIERHDNQNIKYVIKRTSKRQSAKDKEIPVWWLQNQMYERKLDDQILLFLTDALKLTNSLSVLELKNLDNNEDITFWLPFSTALKVLKLNIRKCTLLLCQEWKNEKPINLKEVVIKSISIDESTRCVLVKALDTCNQLTKRTLPLATITNINEIMLPRLDYTTNNS